MVLFPTAAQVTLKVIPSEKEQTTSTVGGFQSGRLNLQVASFTTKMSRETLAIVGHAPNEPPEFETIRLEAPRPDEAIVEIHAVGICHADVAVLHGTIPLPFPRVLGHEG